MVSQLNPISSKFAKFKGKVKIDIFFLVPFLYKYLHYIYEYHIYIYRN